MNKEKLTIYIFGNPLLAYDNTPFALVDELRKEFPDINFVETDPNENIHPHDGMLVIIDTVADIDEVIVIDDITDIDKIVTNPNYSMHDLDLGFMLKLLKKIGELTDILIFGVPQKNKKRVVYKQLVSLMKKNLPKIITN